MSYRGSLSDTSSVTLPSGSFSRSSSISVPTTPERSSSISSTTMTINSAPVAATKKRSSFTFLLVFNSLYLLFSLLFQSHKIFIDLDQINHNQKLFQKDH